MKNIVIFGATSAIAHATARRFAADGAKLFLIARSEKKLQAVKDDLKTLGAAKVESVVADASEFSRHREILAQAEEKLGSIDGLLIAHGTLPSQEHCQADLEETLKQVEINGTSVISLLTLTANIMEQQGHGTIAVISSVAGDRGRMSNYVYGASKAMVTAFLQGLRNRLFHQGVRVVTIKPGFVDTPMTADFPKGPLWASPEQVAKGIHRAMRKGRDVVYLPWFWRYIMLIIRSIPEFVFKRLKL